MKKYSLVVPALLTIVLAAALLPALASAQAPAYLTQWGSLGSGNGQFNYPDGVAVDGTGNLYVADANNNRIQKFTTSGTYLTQWGVAGSNPGQFNSPGDVTVQRPGGSVYVVDRGNNRVEKFGPGSVPAASTSWGRIKALYR